MPAVPPVRSILALVVACALAPCCAARAALQAAPANAPVQDAEAVARALWDGVVAAAAGAAQERVQAFVLEFDATRYSGERQSNDISATYSFLAPGFVRMLLKSGRERLRGPKGDWLLDKTGAHRLVGRDFKQDVVELDDSVAVARTFAHLVDPRGVHVERVTLLDAPPAGLPESERALAAELDWISLWSSDFRGAPPKPGTPADRVDLGLARASSQPRLAVVTYATQPGEAPNALALRLDDLKPLDGFRVPWRVTAWRLDAALHPPGFGARASFDLWLVKGTLAPAPALTAADFEPPAR